MLRRHHLVQATALSLTLASCVVPFAGTNSTGVPGAAAPPLPAALPTAQPIAPVVVPSLAPAPPVADDARVRLRGTVVLNDAPVAGAVLTAIDLATGKAIDLKAWSDSPGGGATGTQRTNAKGAFDLELPRLEEDRVVKLVAVVGTQTFTSLFDARGRAVGAHGAPGATYRLAQGRAVSITIRLRLTAATTAAAKAFEGALKLTFQLPEAAREAERAAGLAAAEQAAREVEAALAERPELAQNLVVSVGTDGEVQDLDAFRSAVAKLRVFDPVFDAVQGRLQAVTAQKLTADGQLDAITAEDFPLDRVTITREGGFSFTGGSTPVTLGGSVTSNFVPTPERTRRRGAPGRESPRIVSLLAYPRTLFPGFTFLHTPVQGAYLAFAEGPLYTLNGDAATMSSTLSVSGTDSGRRASVAQARNASGTLYVGSIYTGLSYYEPDVEASGVLLTTGTFYAVGADSQRAYYCSLGPGEKVSYVSHADRAASGILQVGGDWEVSYGASMAVFDPSVDCVPPYIATSTVIVGTSTSGSGQNVALGSIFAAQDGGASRTLASALGSIHGLAIATPTLYVAFTGVPANSGSVIALDVNDPTASRVVVSVEEAVAVTGEAAFRPVGLALDDPAAPRYLYVTDRSSGRLLRVTLP